MRLRFISSFRELFRYFEDRARFYVFELQKRLEDMEVVLSISEETNARDFSVEKLDLKNLFQG